MINPRSLPDNRPSVENVPEYTVHQKSRSELRRRRFDGEADVRQL
jgi:hypothetical protein